LCQQPSYIYAYCQKTQDELKKEQKNSQNILCIFSSFGNAIIISCARKVVTIYFIYLKDLRLKIFVSWKFLFLFLEVEGFVVVVVRG
jgi:hypothetical protein